MKVEVSRQGEREKTWLKTTGGKYSIDASAGAGQSSELAREPQVPRSSSLVAVTTTSPRHQPAPQEPQERPAVPVQRAPRGPPGQRVRQALPARPGLPADWLRRRKTLRPRQRPEAPPPGSRARSRTTSTASPRDRRSSTSTTACLTLRWSRTRRATRNRHRSRLSYPTLRSPGSCHRTASPSRSSCAPALSGRTGRRSTTASSTRQTWSPTGSATSA
jgi:hypothetical protein